MAVLATVGILAGIWLSPQREGLPVSLLKAPMPSQDPLFRAKKPEWVEARLKSLWEDLGIPQENVVRSSGTGTQGLAASLEVQLPKHLTLGSASRALEALGREAAGRMEINWEKEETSARLAVINLDGLVTHRILLREQASFQGPRLQEEPKVALIVDDLGGDQRVFKLLKHMGIPLTLAILPAGEQARQMALEAQAQGLEVMVHMPMEPKAYPSRNPGPHALMAAMDGQEAMRLIASQLDQFPQAVGANNHMGSKLTEDPRHMSVLMDALANRSMYFVDSLTSPNSVAYAMARQKGLRAYRRDVFVDNSRNPDEIKEQFQVLLSLALKRGHALAIAHPYPETLALLPELHRLSKAQGIRWVKVSQLPGESFPNTVPLASSKAR